mmetsp:Transcript_56446/g.127575  ORF Transcript_56446/g.127575 Transcript_56446/m.127575 type:complete len:949 (+) Transcript_56446:74-2920(+)
MAPAVVLRPRRARKAVLLVAVCASRACAQQAGLAFQDPAQAAAAAYQQPATWEAAAASAQPAVAQWPASSAAAAPAAAGAASAVGAPSAAPAAAGYGIGIAPEQTAAQALDGAGYETTRAPASTTPSPPPMTSLIPGTPDSSDIKKSEETLATKPFMAVENTQCDGRFKVPPNPPLHATDLNGMQLPDTCFFGPNAKVASGMHHIFVIGDWGGVTNHPWNKTVKAPLAADHRSKHHFKQHYRPFVWGVDDFAQVKVAGQIAKRALKSDPDYFVNVGDNFYWGGINVKCGAPPHMCQDMTHQWQTAYEDVYNGEGIDGKQWLGVLGNHDYGGDRFDKAWDQVVGYTWSPQTTGRWMMPALYWSVKVNYPDFSVDYYFLDTNVFDALAPSNPSEHNICSQKHNSKEASCAPHGPRSISDCPEWFGHLWKEQKAWLAKLVPKSTADWRIVVTHFPPYWGADDWKELAQKHEIDLIVSAHRHSQHLHRKGDSRELVWPDDPKDHEKLYTDFLDPTAWVVSGGGGGTTSEHTPTKNGTDDQYGFMDMTLSKKELKIEAISHGGQLRHTMTVKHHYVHRVQETTTTAAPRTTFPEGSPEVEVADSQAASKMIDSVAGRISQATHAGNAISSHVSHDKVTIVTNTTNSKVASHPKPDSTKDGHRIAKSEGGKSEDVQTFYMYRAMNDNSYPMENVNMANLAGVMWYLHNEVVCSQPRKYGISRIVRMKVQTKAPKKLAEKGINFGARFAYDGQTCTGAGPWVGPQECDAQYKKYGYFVGCNILGEYPFPMAIQGFPVHYKDAVWYSLPKSGHCKGPPTGEDNCTYSYSPAGDLRIDELAGISDYWGAANSKTWKEYDINTDKGLGFSFWNGKYDDRACQKRMEHARKVWRDKYPHDPADEDLQEPKCDFDCHKFYPRVPKDCIAKVPRSKWCNSPEWCRGVTQGYHGPPPPGPST